MCLQSQASLQPLLVWERSWHILKVQVKPGSILNPQPAQFLERLTGRNEPQKYQVRTPGVEGELACLALRHHFPPPQAAVVR